MPMCSFRMPLVRVVTLLAGISLLTAGSAHAVPLFAYQFPMSADTLGPESPVVDLSSAGHSATAYLFAGDPPGSGLSDNVPAGRSGSSVDFTPRLRRIATNDADLLTTTSIVDSGGYTLDTWINASSFPTGNNRFKIFDYAGVDSLRLAPGSTTTKATLLFGNVTSFTTLANVIERDTWYHVVATFNTAGNLPTADTTYAGEKKVSGLATITVDGTITASSTILKSGQGDKLDRGIGVGGHPTSNGETFAGYLYDPMASLGVPEPGAVGLIVAASTERLLRRRRGPRSV